jgi:SAM-dependent methyltransferase
MEHPVSLPPSTGNLQLAKAADLIPFAKEKEGLVFSLQQMFFVSGYYRIVVEAYSDRSIASVDLDLDTSCYPRFAKRTSKVDIFTTFIFDGLIRVEGHQVPEAKSINFVLGDGRRVRLTNDDLLSAHYFYNPAVIKLWDEIYNQSSGLFLEIGGRGDVSAAVRSRLPSGWTYTSVDILPGANVDIVGDVHRLVDVVEQGSVDVVYSSSVFEHLSQPWLAALQANKVLRKGGLCFSDAPHAFPLHAKPWDFWRYTPWTWQHIFSEKAGFQVAEVGLYGECSIVPLVMRDWNNQQVAGEGGGWLGTACLARKVADSDLDWCGYDANQKILYPYLRCED